MLVRCEDFGPLTRIVGACSLVAHDVDVPVVLMDDDIAYRRSALDAALTCFCKHPGEVCAFAGYDRLDRQGNRYKSIRQFATFITSLQTLRRLEWAEMRFRCDAIVDIPMQFRCDIAWVRLAPMRLDSHAISTWRCDATHPCRPTSTSKPAGADAAALPASSRCPLSSLTSDTLLSNFVTIIQN